MFKNLNWCGVSGCVDMFELRIILLVECVPHVHGGSAKESFPDEPRCAFLVPFFFHPLSCMCRCSCQFHNTWGFQIRLTESNNFLGGHRFTATTNLFEASTKIIDLDGFINGVPKVDKNKKNHHFIWIGIINQHSPRKVEMQQNMYCVMIITPPRLIRLRIKQQQFRQSTE